MGIQPWQLRDRFVAPLLGGTLPSSADEGDGILSPLPCNTEPSQILARQVDGHVATAEVSGLDWSALETQIAGCQQCPELVSNRTQAIVGAGHHEVEWLVVGAAPEGDEDRQGTASVGEAGELLTQMLWAIGLDRKQVYITHVIKCRPPRDRLPTAVEVAACSGYLARQIALIRPRMILALGQEAAHALLASDAALDTLRGQCHQYRDSGTPLVVTYHPSDLLRVAEDKRKAWQDLQLAVTNSAGEGR